MGQEDFSRRILVTRLSAVGDCVLTLPLVCALRDHLPGTRIIWAVEPLAASLLDGHRAVDEFLVMPKGWLKSPRRIGGVRRRLRQVRPDWVVDPQSLSKSSLLGWISGAKRRIGFAPPRGRELARWCNNELVDVPDPHLVDATLRLLEPFGIREPDVKFDVPIPREVDAKIEHYVREAFLTQGYVVINSAASCQARLWPASRFGRVARYLGEQHDLPSVVTWAGPGEADLARRIIAKSGGHAVMAPATSLKELAALERQACLMIGSDTGPLHLAAAVGTPCVGLYGPTRPARSGPYGTHHRVIESAEGVRRHGRRRRLDDSAMWEISVERVCEACDHLLRHRAARASAA